MIATWPLAATLFDGESTGGPVPTLFSPDENASSTALNADIHKAHWDLNKLAKVFFVAENLPVKDIIPLLKKPR